MGNNMLAVVTGPFGFTGRYITRILLDKGWRVKGLSGHLDRPDPFAGAVKVAPFEFDRPHKLAEKLSGADVVFNTYWVRFNRGRTTYGQAVANLENLVHAAAEAGVKKFVHISITNPAPDATWEYFRGKFAMEKAIIQSGLAYGIVRPTVLFGKEDLLFNNIAWLLRNLPMVAIPGRGEYRLRPVYVNDLAGLAVELAETEGSFIRDAVGPESFSYHELVSLIKRVVKSRALLVRVPPIAALVMAKAVGLFIGDEVLVADELTEVINGRFHTSGPTTCPTRLSAWMEENADSVGRAYANELKRHFA